MDSLGEGVIHVMANVIYGCISLVFRSSEQVLENHKFCLVTLFRLCIFSLELKEYSVGVTKPTCTTLFELNESLPTY